MRMSSRSVVVNGDLGSGKTTVTVLLAERLGIRRVSIGDLYRTMAAQRGMTALQLNMHAELDDKIDHYVDQLQKDIAASGERLVVDSRLAWHFFTNAVKVHLITEPSEAARRVLGRPADDVERYASVDEALEQITSRSESERVRFITRYGVDKTRLRNYDLVCDTTRATPDEVVEAIVGHLHEDPTDDPVCHLDPARIRPTTDHNAAGGQVAVGYHAPHFFAVDGHSALRAATRDGATLIRATLVAEGAETIDGVPCGEYVRRWAHAGGP
jgi:cytidylate kinase